MSNVLQPAGGSPGVTGVVPQAGTCDSCGIPLSDEDGYVVLALGEGYRHCDDCPADPPSTDA